VRSLACGKVGIEIHDLRPTHGSCRGKKGNPKPPNGLRRLRSKWPIYLCSALGIQTLEHRGSCMWNKRLFQDEWGTAALTTKTWLAMVHLVRHFDGDVPERTVKIPGSDHERNYTPGPKTDRKRIWTNVHFIVTYFKYILNIFLYKCCVYLVRDRVKKWAGLLSLTLLSLEFLESPHCHGFNESTLLYMSCSRWSLLPQAWQNKTSHCIPLNPIKSHWIPPKLTGFNLVSRKNSWFHWETNGIMGDRSWNPCSKFLRDGCSQKLC
jgi:hypothetical protein